VLCYTTGKESTYDNLFPSASKDLYPKGEVRVPQDHPQDDGHHDEGAKNAPEVARWRDSPDMPPEAPVQALIIPNAHTGD
jgi:hypothetical protein